MDQVARLKKLLQSFFGVHGITVDAGSLQMWLDGFFGLSIEAVELAIRRFNRESSERPTPERVRRYAGAAGLSDEQRAQAAWRVVRSTVMRHGAYWAINFDDPIIHAAIRAIGGWVALCNTPHEEMVWRHKAFVEAYVSVARSGIGEFQPLSGLLTNEAVSVITGLLPHDSVAAIEHKPVQQKQIAIPDLRAERAG